jgi:hypothetical protein
LCQACAMAQAIERLLATPNTIPNFPASNDMAINQFRFTNQLCKGRLAVGKITNAGKDGKSWVGDW